MKKNFDVKKLTTGAILTALVIILQLLGSFIKFGPFSVSLVLVPIVIGAAVCGAEIGAWLGFVFGGVVLMSGDAASFYAVNALGTVLTVLLKGTAAGFLAGIVYKLVAKKSSLLAVIAAAVVCPVVNTGVFILGSYVFFLDTIKTWAAGSDAANVTAYIFLVLVGANFLFELLTNLLLSPTVVKLLDYCENIFGSKKKTAK